MPNQINARTFEIWYFCTLRFANKQTFLKSPVVGDELKGGGGCQNFKDTSIFKIILLQKQEILQIIVNTINIKYSIITFVSTYSPNMITKY